ncbi:uncharacterized protein LOC119343747 [Triticum dicoccoides]|uniref:uncharacterized protein LOC119343747 n=1 Tax=Triticum dicoccoides TaxID=85692 RepID=UPI00188EB944|nr:uncharacterized protein LOC119343747 [Triticum dicoccoides]
MEAEEVLTHDMGATITGTRPSISPAKVETTLHTMFDLQPSDFTMHLHALEDFLIFSSWQIMDSMAGDHLINADNFTLLLRPWCKLAHPTAGSFVYSVQLELRGIPTQAWHLSIVEHILGAGCRIERLHPDTRSCADLATSRLAGRVRDPATIRQAAILEIVEQVPAPRPGLPLVVRTLEYRSPSGSPGLNPSPLMEPPLWRQH